MAYVAGCGKSSLYFLSFIAVFGDAASRSLTVSAVALVAAPDNPASADKFFRTSQFQQLLQFSI